MANNKIKLPANLEFSPKPWDHTHGTDYYGALDVAGEYCGFRCAPSALPGVWQHGCTPPWQYVQPEIVVYRAPRSCRCFVGRLDTRDYLRQSGYSKVTAVGLPIIYTQSSGVERVAGSLLVMPTHALPTSVASPAFDKYVSQIAAVRGKFTETFACVSANCIAKGYWAPQFQSAGISIVRGAAISDRNALRRMRALFERFEYVTTDGFGSHVFYALYFGAKVSIWGESTPVLRENLLRDGTWAAFPDAVDRFLSKENQRKAETYLGRLRVDPWIGVNDVKLGRWMLGHENKLSPHQLRQCFGWTPFRLLNAKIGDKIRATRLWRSGTKIKRQLRSSSLQRRSAEFRNKIDVHTR